MTNDIGLGLVRRIQIDRRVGDIFVAQGPHGLSDHFCGARARPADSRLAGEYVLYVSIATVYKAKLDGTSRCNRDMLANKMLDVLGDTAGGVMR